VKYLILPLIFIISITNEAQAQFDDYKYIVVPKRFDGFSNDNQHQTSSLVKQLFDKKGFNTAYQGALPDDLEEERCLGIYVHMLDKSTMFTTKTTLIMKDCQGKEVFTSLQGRSKEKDYKASYTAALKDAFRSFEGISHSYVDKTPEVSEEPVAVSFKNDIKKLERPNLSKNQDPMVEQESSEERQYYKDHRPVTSDYRKVEDKEVKKDMVNQVATPEEQSFESETPEESNIIKGESTISSSPNVFFAKADSINGVVFSQAGKWIFEYYYEDQLMSKELNIKF